MAINVENSYTKCTKNTTKSFQNYFSHNFFDSNKMIYLFRERKLISSERKFE